MSTSRRGSCSKEQLPSGLRAKSTGPEPVAAKLPLAAENRPVPPTTSTVCCTVALKWQLCPFPPETEKSTSVLTMRVLPSAKTKSSRLTLSGSVGRFGISTIRPTPLNTPLATITLLTTVRVPDRPDVTTRPFIVSFPLVCAAAGAAIASAIPMASSAQRAPLTCRLMLPPLFVRGRDQGQSPTGLLVWQRLPWKAFPVPVPSQKRSGWLWRIVLPCTWVFVGGLPPIPVVTT